MFALCSSFIIHLIFFWLFTAYSLHAFLFTLDLHSLFFCVPPETQRIPGCSWNERTITFTSLCIFHLRPSFCSFQSPLLPRFRNYSLCRTLNLQISLYSSLSLFSFDFCFHFFSSLFSFIFQLSLCASHSPLFIFLLFKFYSTFRSARFTFHCSFFGLRSILSVLLSVCFFFFFHFPTSFLAIGCDLHFQSNV